MLDEQTFSRAVAERPLFALLPFLEDGTFDFMPDEAYLPFAYKVITGHELDLERPSSFNDKIAWLKLHDRNPLYRELVDKFRVRGFVAEQLGEEWLVPLLGVWNEPEEVDFDTLPDRFALKVAHGQGGVVVCRDKGSLDRAAAVSRLRATYDRDFFSPAREWTYIDPQPRVIAEAFVDDGGEKPADYKFFCMNGEARVACVSRAVGAAHEEEGSISFFWADGSRAPFKRVDYPEFEGDLELPACWDEMRCAAERLAGAIGAPFVRVDFFCAGGYPFFSEFTFYPCGGTMLLDPPEFDRALGEMLVLPCEFEQLMRRFPRYADASADDVACYFTDFMRCVPTVKAEPIDYFKYVFCEKDAAGRATFLTRRRYAALTEHVNDAVTVEGLLDKAAFYERFSAFLGRSYAVAVESQRSAFDALCATGDRMVIKPRRGGYGKGVSIVGTGELDKLWMKCSSDDLIAEELLIQHPALARLFPGSVNSARVVTALGCDGDVRVIACTLRCGRGGMVTDSGNGLFADVDLETGIIDTDGVSHFAEHFECHPDTGVRFQGFELPNFRGLFERACAAAESCPELRLMNWDWACREDGTWCLIEGNFSGGIGPCQEATGKGYAQVVLDALGLQEG